MAKKDPENRDMSADKVRTVLIVAGEIGLKKRRIKKGMSVNQSARILKRVCELEDEKKSKQYEKDKKLRLQERGRMARRRVRNVKAFHIEGSLICPHCGSSNYSTDLRVYEEKHECDKCSAISNVPKKILQEARTAYRKAVRRREMIERPNAGVKSPTTNKHSDIVCGSCQQAHAINVKYLYEGMLLTCTKCGALIRIRKGMFDEVKKIQESNKLRRI